LALTDGVRALSTLLYAVRTALVSAWLVKGGT